MDEDLIANSLPYRTAKTRAEARTRSGKRRIIRHPGAAPRATVILWCGSIRRSVWKRVA